MTGTPQPFDLPPEECLVLVCAYIEHLLATAPRSPPSSANDTKAAAPAPALPTPPDAPPPPPRRSLDYVAERPNGSVARVIGEEYGIGTGYDEVDLQRQRERIALRFSSKTVPKIPIADYLERSGALYPVSFHSFVVYMVAWTMAWSAGLGLMVAYASITMSAHRCSLPWLSILTEWSIPPWTT